MSHYLLDLNKEEINFDWDKLIVGKKISGDRIQKYYIYYVDNEPKELYIKFPNIRLIYNYANNKYNQIKLPIYPMYDKTKAFVKFITELEEKLVEKIKAKVEISSLLEDKNKIKYIKFLLPENTKIKSNKTNVTFKDFKANGEVECIMRLPHFWVKTESCGINLSCYQIKYTPPSEEKELDFFEEEKPKITSMAITYNLTAPPPPPPPPPMLNKHLEEAKNVQKFVPSVNDLKNKMKQLNKVHKDE